LEVSRQRNEPAKLVDGIQSAFQAEHTPFMFWFLFSPMVYRVHAAIRRTWKNSSATDPWERGWSRRRARGEGE
jgi:hypothetical protein